jgi:exodeoxyribonuclease VII large subunit
VHLADARPAFAGLPGRIAMRGRHASELTHLVTASMRAALLQRQRRVQQCRRQLDGLSPERRVAAIRTRLVAADARLAAARGRMIDRPRSALRHVVSQLEALSPLAVLGRGYAVCWTADRTRVIRDAASTRPGDRVRVTLARGELDCEIMK